ncbi:MAG: deoxyguanosinetriphosphate triphosphohydrolase [Firmicutes bacterium]|nr:deoxyguanosinetriphosphate triphosphohydrolase [Bacillota bacterium]
MKREDFEHRELLILSPYAAKSIESRGRRFPTEPCPLRTEFQRDRDRIIHSKSFRRLKYKTQVFLPGGGDHFRTRLTHTLEVAQIGRTMARGLGLNEDLTEAIGLGHDLGHTPFGHAGERMIDSLMRPEYEFHHNEQSLRIVDVLEAGKGMNLTEEVRDGIIHHTGDVLPFTLEGRVIRFADRIAYVNHDIDDAIRIGLLKKEDLPTTYRDFLGESHGSRINALVMDIIDASQGICDVRQSPLGEAALTEMRTFLFDHLYTLDTVRAEEEKGCHILESLFRYYMEHPSEIPESIPDGPLKVRVKDYVAGMTDKFASESYKDLFIPKDFHF